jgi:hypothetical protein
LASGNHKFPERGDLTFHHGIYWMFAIFINITILFLVWISTLSIITYLIGFFGSFGEPKAGLYLKKVSNKDQKLII